MRLALHTMEDWGPGGWHIIERAEHDGLRPPPPLGPPRWGLQCASRISDADVEGTTAQMLALAYAIRAGEPKSFKRCAVSPQEDGSWHFYSPRNSTRPGVVPNEDAQDIANQIIERLEKS